MQNVCHSENRVFDPPSPHVTLLTNMFFFPNSIGCTLFLHIFGSLNPKIIVVLAENQYHGLFKAIKISKFAQFPLLRKNAKICLTYAIVLKFAQDHHHNDKRSVS